jgi:hypothetical protein
MPIHVRCFDFDLTSPSVISTNTIVVYPVTDLANTGLLPSSSNLDSLPRKIVDDDGDKGTLLIRRCLLASSTEEAEPVVDTESWPDRSRCRSHSGTTTDLLRSDAVAQAAPPLARCSMSGSNGRYTMVNLPPLELLLCRDDASSAFSTA